METIEYKRIDVELTTEERDTLENASDILRELVNNIMKEKQLSEIWCYTYDGEEMVTNEQVVAAYETLDSLLNIKELM